MPKHEDAEDSPQCNIECYQDTRTATSLLIPPSLDRYKQTFSGTLQLSVQRQFSQSHLFVARSKFH